MYAATNVLYNIILKNSYKSHEMPQIVEEETGTRNPNSKQWKLKNNI